MGSFMSWLKGLGISGRTLTVGALALVTIGVVIAVQLSSPDGQEPDTATTAGTAAPTTVTTVATAAATTDPPISDLLAASDGTTPGEVTQHGALTNPPVIEADLPEPAPEPVGLEPVEAPGDEFFEEPDPVSVDAVAGAIGDLTSNAPGCASNCIVRAILRPGLLSADLDFELETNVATTARIWMTTAQVFWLNDVPFVDGIDPLAENTQASHEWEAEVEPLEFSTTYQVILEVSDQLGNTTYAATEYTTVDPPTPGQLAGSGGGCYYQCIVWGEVTRTFDYDTVILTVQTTVPVEFDIAVSSDPIGYIGDSPLLNPDETLEVDELIDNYIRARIVDLEPDTTYNVLLTVTDENGFEAHAIGDFHTDEVPPEPTNVFLRLERVTIIEDGDPVGRGEIKLVWGFDGTNYLGIRDWDDISSGTTITLAPESGSWVQVPPEGDLPNFVVNVIENDYVPYTCPFGEGTLRLASGDDGCGHRWNAAATGALPLSFLPDMDVCSSFFTVPFGQDRPCIEISSQDLGNAWPHFTAIVSFATE